MATSIRTILHTTSQRSALVRFYREGLGLGDPEHGGGGEEWFQLGDLSLRISSEGSGSGSRLRGPVPRTTLTFAVDDLEEHVEHLKAIGVPFDVEASSDGNGSRRAVCRDPDGNFIMLLSGPRVTRKQKDDDGRPSRGSRKAKKNKAAHKAAKSKSVPKKKAAKKSKPAKRPASKKSGKKKKKK